LVLPILIALIASFVVLGTALAATIDPAARTVITPRFELHFSATNPEEISYLSWNGSANLTNTGVNDCGDPLEYFGNSWSSPDSGDFVSLVGWGQAGTWGVRGSNAVVVNSVSESSSGCFGALDIPVETNYRFWDHGPAADRIQVRRTFDFRSIALTQDFRPFMPRLYPSDGFSQVWHPNASGTSLLLEDPSLCELGCQVADWDNTWFAIHNPTTDSGLIVRRDLSSYDADLWVDQDGASFTNATGALLIAPAGGFTERLTEVQFLCFYDSSSWSPSLSLPPGC
jgi:hypothetical protein